MYIGMLEPIFIILLGSENILAFSINSWNSLNFFHVEDKDLYTLHGDYHSCWWTDDAGRQGINNHGIKSSFPWLLQPQH